MDTKPLSSGSLKAVLQYMEANLRFQIANRCPTIRKTEQSVPLKIDFLDFGQNQLIVNRTIYKLGIYRKYHCDKIPNLLQNQNVNGGVDHDLDQFGIGDADVWNLILPGDIKIENGVTYAFPGDGGWEKFDRDLVELEKEWKLKQDQLAESSGQDMQQVQTEISRLEQRIEYVRFVLIPYYCRRDNVLAPFDNFLQLTITSPNGEHIERFNYSKKLYEAHKYLSSLLFGNRLPIIQVKRLKMKSHHVIRLPLSVKFKIRELETTHKLSDVYDALRPIVEESSYPLEVLDIYWLFQIPVNQVLDKITNAKQIIIELDFLNMERILSRRNLSHRRMHISFDSDSPTVQKRLVLIKNWLEKGREIRTVYTFGIRRERTASDIFKSIKNQFQGTISGQKCLTVPMSTTSELKISYKAVTINRYFKEPWLLTMEVVPVRSEKDNIAVEPQ